MDSADSGLVYTLIGALTAVISAAFAFLIKDRQDVITENRQLRAESVSVLKASAQLAEKVPDLTNQHLQAVLEIQRLNQRLADLEK